MSDSKGRVCARSGISAKLEPIGCRNNELKDKTLEASFSEFNHLDSVVRIKEILASEDSSYEEKDSIPARTQLTFSNGFNVKASAIYVDIRGSSDLAEKHKRPTLAKLYRSYISELVAVLTGDLNVSEIYIEGDAVWGVFDTPYQKDVNRLFSTAARASSLIDILNYYYTKNGISQIVVGMGLTYGSALFLKAGYKGSSIYEVVWLGKMVAEASTLSSYGRRDLLDKRMMVSELFHYNLNDHNKALLEWNSTRGCYHGYIVNIEMSEWLKSRNG